MTTAALEPKPGRRAVDLTASILLMVAGLIVVICDAILDIVLALTSADSPGDVEGATSLAFVLLFVAAAVWLATTILAIVFLVRRRSAWWVALIGAVVPVLAGLGGFVAVTSVVQ